MILSGTILLPLRVEIWGTASPLAKRDHRSRVHISILLLQRHLAEGILGIPSRYEYAVLVTVLSTAVPTDNQKIHHQYSLEV